VTKKLELTLTQSDDVVMHKAIYDAHWDLM